MGAEVRIFRATVYSFSTRDFGSYARASSIHSGICIVHSGATPGDDVWSTHLHARFSDHLLPCPHSASTDNDLHVRSSARLLHSHHVYPTDNDSCIICAVLNANSN